MYHGQSECFGLVRRLFLRLLLLLRLLPSPCEDGGRQIFQAAAWTLLIIPLPMRPQSNLGFGYRGKGFTIQKLIAQFAVEALRKAVLPRTAWINIVRRCPVFFEPALHFSGDELRTLITADKTGNAP
jgi:hypothetical protein